MEACLGAEERERKMIRMGRPHQHWSRVKSGRGGRGKVDITFKGLNTRRSLEQECREEKLGK